MKYKKGDKVMFEKNCQGATYQRNYYPKYHEVGEIVEVGYDDYQVIFNDDKSCYTYLTDEEVIAFNDNSITISNTTGDVLTLNNNGFTFTGSTGKSITGYEPEKQEMEEKEMKNEVLELWYKRENAKLKSEFKSEIEKYVNEHPVVVRYKEIINAYTDSMSTLLEEYADFDIVSHISYSVLDDVDLRDIEKKLQDMYLKNNATEHEKMLSKLQDTYETIKAMLSLSDDLEYQLDVLSKYKVIDKKTKKMVD